MNIFKRFFAFLRYYSAVTKAQVAAAANGGARHFVIPAQAGSRRLLVLDRKNFRALKRKHYIPQNATMADVLRECFYFTVTPQQEKEHRKLLDAKYEQYLRWFELSGRKG